MDFVFQWAKISAATPSSKRWFFDHSSLKFLPFVLVLFQLNFFSNIRNATECFADTINRKLGSWDSTNDCEFRLRLINFHSFLFDSSSSLKKSIFVTNFFEIMVRFLKHNKSWQLHTEFVLSTFQKVPFIVLIFCFERRSDILKMKRQRIINAFFILVWSSW